jgi:hypothetical protein
MQIRKKLFRIQHQRSLGEKPFIMLQNRVIEAETAEQALRMAMPAKAAIINASSDDLAIAERKVPNSFSELWTASADEDD